MRAPFGTGLDWMNEAKILRLWGSWLDVFSFFVFRGRGWWVESEGLDRDSSIYCMPPP